MKVSIESLTAIATKTGYITGRIHPTKQLTIWNYTPKAQYEQVWSDDIKMCRGLITRLDGEVVARPWPKFFNLDENKTPIPNERFEVTEKLDGSLIIVANVDGDTIVATRGSFDSEQARHARELLSTKYASEKFLPGYTYLFELIALLGEAVEGLGVEVFARRVNELEQQLALPRHLPQQALDRPAFFAFDPQIVDDLLEPGDVPWLFADVVKNLFFGDHG